MRFRLLSRKPDEDRSPTGGGEAAVSPAIPPPANEPPTRCWYVMPTAQGGMRIVAAPRGISALLEREGR